MKNPTLIQMTIEAIVSRSELYKDLKAQNDENIECIDKLSAAVNDLNEALSRLTVTIAQQKHVLDDIITMFNSDPMLDMVMDDVHATDKDKLN